MHASCLTQACQNNPAVHGFLQSREGSATADLLWLEITDPKTTEVWAGGELGPYSVSGRTVFQEYANRKDSLCVLAMQSWRGLC